MACTASYDVFDIVGPVMIGPSSSHTAGAVRIGLMAGQLCGYAPKRIVVGFHGSLASTYTFHKTDYAVIAGVLGIAVDDDRIKTSVQLAEAQGITVAFKKIALENAHPSTIVIELLDAAGREHVVRSATIGGGNIVVEDADGYRLGLDGKQDCLFGTVAASPAEVEAILAKAGACLGVVRCVSGKNGTVDFSFVSNEPVKTEILERIKADPRVKSAGLLKAIMPPTKPGRPFYRTCREVAERAAKEGVPISDIVIRFEAEKSGRSEEQVLGEMREAYRVMQDSVRKGVEKENRLLGNIFHGNAAKLDSFLKAGKSLSGSGLTRMVRNALAVMEVNGSMGKVVACPTAGSAGTVPAVLVTIAEEKGLAEDAVVKALFTGAGLGIVIAENASISGAVCGCQGECGSASAIAAAVLTEIFGGSPEQVLGSVSLAFGNLLGMVCDPVAGMVEVPCIQRNTVAALNAVIAAEMALAGVDCVIPADEMIGALAEVGRLMPVSLKDTLGAGISNTPTAREIEKRIFVSTKGV